MEVLASRTPMDFMNISHKEEYLGYSSNLTKLQTNGSECTQDASFLNRTVDNLEVNVVQSWVDSTQQPSCSNTTLPLEDAIENNTALERDQSQIKYLLSRLPILAEQFNIHRKVGEGTFSSVFLGTLKNVDPRSRHKHRQFAIKHLVPTTLPARTEKELQCLQEIGGYDNVIGVDLCLRQGDCVVFIMPYLPHKRFSDYVQEMAVAETREYMRNLFIALRRVHSFNIIHRDIKPSNFLYDRENKKFLLVDFGLAQNASTAEMVVHDTPAPEPVSYKKKRKREEDDKDSSHQETPVIHRSKRMALQPRTNENMMNISRNDTSQNHRSGYVSSEAKKFNTENEVHNLGLTPSKNKVLGPKNENTPPNSKHTPKRKLLMNDTARSPLRDNRNSIKHNSIKKKLFSACSPRISTSSCTGGPKFQTLAPETPNGPSFVRVQNSQVKSHLMSPPVSTQQHKKLVFSKPSPVTQVHSVQSKIPSGQNCQCYGKPKVCSICLVRKVQAAPRAGTPGFRPPEVLLKYPLQTTAVDMWAAGIILLCILSGCYPFFRSPDDLSALAEIMSLFGTEKIKSVAVKLGRLVTCSVEKKALNLRKLCERLRHHREAGRPSIPPGSPICSECTQVIDLEEGCICLFPGDNYEPSKRGDPNTQYPSSVYHLLERLLDLDPETRITASEALEHPFVKGF